MWGGSLLVLGSPKDGSGLFSPSIGWDITETASLRLSGFIPWGPSPHDGQLGSEYGSTPASVFLQLSLYF